MRLTWLGTIVSLLISATLGLAQDACLFPQVPECPRGDAFWGSAEYLLWWFKSSPEPVPLVTTVPAGATFVPFVTGSLGQSDTQVLLGGSSINTDPRSGARVTAGHWLDAEQTVGVEGSYLFLGGASATQGVVSGVGPAGTVLANPLFSVGPLGVAGETANYIAFPGGQGSATLSVSSHLQGAELSGRVSAYAEGGLRLDLLAGFRWLQLSEGLDFATTEMVVSRTGGVPGQFANTLDQFGTQNNFFAGQVGVRGEWNVGRWSVAASAKLALGDMNESATVAGFTTLNSTDFMRKLIPTTTVPGGIYALPTNIGTYNRNTFAVAPEGSLTLSYHPTDRLRLSIGYDFLYVDRVARPGTQIDRTINQTQLPSLTGAPSGPLVGAARPAFAFQDSSFWAQGIHVGVEFRF